MFYNVSRSTCNWDDQNMVWSSPNVFTVYNACLQTCVCQPQLPACHAWMIVHGLFPADVFASACLVSRPRPPFRCSLSVLESWAGPKTGAHKPFNGGHISDYPFDVQTRLRFRLFVDYGDSDCHLGSSFGGLCPYPDRQVVSVRDIASYLFSIKNAATFLQ